MLGEKMGIIFQPAKYSIMQITKTNKIEASYT